MVFDFNGLSIEDWFFTKITIDSSDSITIDLEQLKEFEEACETYNTYLWDTPLDFDEYQVHYTTCNLDNNLFEVEYWCMNDTFSDSESD